MTEFHMRPESDMGHEFYVPPHLNNSDREEFVRLVRLGYETWRNGSWIGAMSQFDKAEAIADAAKLVCKTCKRPLNQPGQPDTNDCGGDCVRCMAESGDPECKRTMGTTIKQTRDDPRFRVTTIKRH